MDLNVQTTNLRQNIDENDSIIAINSIVNEVFANEGLKDTRIISEPFKISEDRYAIVKVIDVIPSRVKSLAEVKTHIVDAIERQGLSQQAKAFGEKLLAEINDGGSPQDKLASIGLEWNKINKISRADDNINSEIMDAIFGISE